MVTQCIVLRKDLNLSETETVVVTVDAAMAFVNDRIIKNLFRRVFNQTYCISFDMDDDTIEWIEKGSHKTLLTADSLDALEEVIKNAEEAGLEKDVDFYCIYQNELTAVGFCPMNEKKIKKVLENLQFK